MGVKEVTFKDMEIGEYQFIILKKTGAKEGKTFTASVTQAFIDDHGIENSIRRVVEDLVEKVKE